MSICILQMSDFKDKCSPRGQPQCQCWYTFAQVHCTTMAYEDWRIDRPNSQLMPANFNLVMAYAYMQFGTVSPPYNEFYPVPTGASRVHRVALQ